MKQNLLRFPSINQSAKPDIINILAIAAIWTIMVILVNPIGDFPLNDDWAYGRSVQSVVEKGDFQLSDWTATNLLSQVYWGALFCLPFGFSFTALRFSTLTLGLIGVLATYGLLREVKASSTISIVAAFVIALNPIYFSLSNSFNSDVPSFTFTTLSLYFLIRGLQRNSRLEIIIGLVLSFISILNRQSGLVILPAFGFAYLSKKGVSLSTIIKAAAPTILGIFLQLLYSHWLRIKGQTPLLYNFQIEQLLNSFSHGFIEIILRYATNILIILVYLAIFLLPFLIVEYFSQFKELSAWQIKITTFTMFFMGAIGVVFIAKGNQLPFVGNSLDFFGIGPQALDGYYAFLAPGAMGLIRIGWKVMTLIGVAGAVILFQYFLFAMLQLISQNQKNKLDKKWLIILISFTAFLYFLPIGGLDKKYWFDRYLIFLLPLLMMLVSISAPSSSKNNLGFRAVSISLIVLLFYGGFTISATHDYLSWNRVRWQALNNLMQQNKILPNQIDGGFEFNGWYFGQKLETCNPAYQQKSAKKSVRWGDFTCLWGGERYKYTVSFVPKTGYEVENQYSFRRWLPLRQENLYVLHKIN